MKAFFICILLALTLAAGAQNKNLQSLPTGKYETVLINGKTGWERGDIVLLENNRYKISSSNEVGDYKFSSVAQRIFFISGPLKSVFAKTTVTKDTPAIILPVDENESLGMKLPSDVWCFYKR